MRFMTAGESHGSGLIAILEGLPAGLSIDVEIINKELARRQRGFGAGPRMKIEQDAVNILGGVMAGETTGAPIAMQIRNKDHEKWFNREIDPFVTPRPGHADLTGTIKYGYRDLRPALERASARETAARVAVGAVCKHFLAQFGVEVGGYVVAIGGVTADVEDIPLAERSIRAEASEVRCPEPEAAEKMAAAIREIMQARDTLGGVIEVLGLGLPPGLGSHVHWDRRLEARLGAAVLSIQAMKGVEIGPAFENTSKPGTQVQDPILLEGEELVRPSNKDGGLEGGITTGQPLIIRAAMKPIATTLTPQQTVNLKTGEQVPTQYERSDFCPVPRAVPIVEAMVSFILADVLIEKLGGDSLDEMRPRFDTLQGTNLSDLQMDGDKHIWWPE
ncbi:MAG: chorismate synthase [Chloroflexota bacterium]|nr:MAG: chorismate synthase [Chloroflexota bacterium]